MLHWKKTSRVLVALMLLGLFLAACQAEPEVVEVTRVIQEEVEVTRVVTETITEEGVEVEVTRIVTEVEEVEVVVTAAPEEEAPADFTDPTPDTLVEMTFGDISTMDPNLVYDTASGQLIENVMEGLIYYNFKDGTSFIPMLATEVPSAENAGISEDGLTYTFNIRDGVTFHEGGTLEPHDVAYTFQRGLLQSDPNSAQWLLLEPMLGFNNCYDITEALDPECGLAGDPAGLVTAAEADAAAVTAVCDMVQQTIVADDEAGTVTMNLAVPWGPFLATIAQSWGYILDSEWAMEQGAWDGTCENWWAIYAPGVENSPLTGVINGTGPYRLDHWTPNEEYALVANENYWRTEPMWEGGPSGAPRIQNVVVSLVDEWGTRFAAFQAGDAEFVTVPLENYPQVDQFVGEICNWETDECVPSEENPNGPFRAWPNLPATSKSHVFMTFNIAPDSPYIGSGQLDGNGIPPDFFSDINVRRAMHYCFDHETYIADAQNGLGVRTNGPVIRDMLGYPEDGPQYDFDLEACAAELEQAWGGQLPETGFRLTIAYNTGNTARQAAAEILQANLRAINDKYQVDVLGLPWPTFLNAFQVAQLPMMTSGWAEDIHDPHNWVQPFTIGTYAGRTGMPQELIDKYTLLVNAGVAAANPEERAQVYYELQQEFYNDAISIPLSQATGTHYEQRWVQDWFNRVGAFGYYFYAYGLDGGG